MHCMIDRGFYSQDAPRLASRQQMMQHCFPIGRHGSASPAKVWQSNTAREPASMRRILQGGRAAYRSLDRFSTIPLQKCRDRPSIEIHRNRFCGPAEANGSQEFARSYVCGRVLHH
jgi:hypothetical protein